jgi:hypothetical protein
MESPIPISKNSAITIENFFNLPCEERAIKGSAWTLAQLKEFAKINGLKATGTKAVLCEVITDYINKNKKVKPEPLPDLKEEKIMETPKSIINIYKEYKVKANPPELIKELRGKIHEFLLKVAPDKKVKSLTKRDLEELFTLYDDYFFDSSIRNYLKEKDEELIVKFGQFRKKQGTAGHCKLKIQGKKEVKKCYHTLGFSLPVLSNVFVDDESEEIETANGIQCFDQLECLQIIMEHEMIHLIINLWNEGKSEEKVNKREAHGKTFKTLARNIFGHSNFRHSLGQGLKEDPAIYIAKVKRYLKPGMKIDTIREDIITPYTVVSVVHRENVKRFRARDKEGKIWTIPFTWVILPEEENIKEGKKEETICLPPSEEKKGEITPPSIVPPVQDWKKILKPGDIVETYNQKTGTETYKVIDINTRSNVIRFVGENQNTKKQYRIPFSWIVKIITHETPTIPKNEDINNINVAMKYKINIGDIVKIKDPKTQEIESIKVTKVNRNKNARRFKGISLKDNKPYVIPYDLIINE